MVTCNVCRSQTCANYVTQILMSNVLAHQCHVHVNVLDALFLFCHRTVLNYAFVVLLSERLIQQLKAITSQGA